MDDANQAGQATSTQSPVSTPASGSAPEGFVEKGRLDGALVKIQELTLANRALTDQVAQLQGKVGSLEGDIAQKSAEWQAQQSEFNTKLTSAESAKNELASQLTAHQAMKLKMKIVGELGAPALYSVLDVVPDMTDEAALREKLQSLAQFAGTISKAREQELMAGITKVEQNPQQAALPTTDAEWQAHITKLNFGTPEYQSAMAAWHAQLFKK